MYVFQAFFCHYLTLILNYYCLNDPKLIYVKLKHTNIPQHIHTLISSSSIPLRALGGANVMCVAGIPNTGSLVISCHLPSLTDLTTVIPPLASPHPHVNADFLADILLFKQC